MKVSSIILVTLALLYMSLVYGGSYFDRQAREIIETYSSELDSLPAIKIKSIGNTDDLVRLTGIHLPKYNPVDFGVSSTSKDLEIYYCSFPLGPCEVFSHASKVWRFEEI